MKKTFFLLFSTLCMLFTGTFSNLTYAYLSDHEPQVNQIGIGTNDSSVEEDFPAPSPITPGKEQTYSKVAAVKNTQSVPCYIRMFVGFSDSDIADSSSYVNLNTSDWVFIPSAQNAKLGGYYYYKTPVAPGTSTNPLFQGIKIDTSADVSSYKNGDTFQVIVYEESVQSAGHADYLSAWDAFLRE